MISPSRVPVSPLSDGCAVTDPDARRYTASRDVMPWDRPLPTYSECDGWRVCDVCGLSWSPKIGGREFLAAWRFHMRNHNQDQLH